MKTTVEIADSLFEEAKACAESRGVPFRHLVEEGLRTVVQRQQKPPGRFRLRDRSFGPTGVGRKVSWAEMRAAIYEGRGA
jgi:hypothetical protein